MRTKITVSLMLQITIIAVTFVGLTVGQLSFAQKSKRMVSSDPIPYGGGFCDRHKRLNSGGLGSGDSEWQVGLLRQEWQAGDSFRV